MRRILVVPVIGILIAIVGSVMVAGSGLGVGISGGLASQVKRQNAGSNDNQSKKNKNKVSKAITAEGTLTPVNYGKLSFKLGGKVKDVPIQAGDTFQSGQPIAWLDSAELDLGVRVAEDNLRLAQMLLEQLKQSARPENARIAEENLRAAEARLARLRSGARAEEIAQTEANLQASEAQLAKLLNGPSPQQLKQAEIGVSRAKNNLYYQQSARDFANSRSIAPMSENQGEALIGIAYEELALAQAQLDALREAPREEDVAQARAAVEAARQKLELVKAPVTPEEIDQARRQQWRSPVSRYNWPVSHILGPIWR